MIVFTSITAILFSGLFGYSLYVLKLVRDDNRELKRLLNELRAYKGR